MLKRNQNAASSKSSASLKLLSDTEKLQLMQLQKTRDKIARELRKYSGADNDGFGFESDDAFGPSFSMSGTAESGFRGLSSSARRAPKSRSGRVGTSSSRPGSTNVTSYIDSIRTGLDMVPVMATSGQFAMGGGNANGAANGKIKLPIFKLPAIDTNRVKSRQQNRTLEKALQQGENFEQRFIPYRDVAGYRKALVLMMKSFGKRDSEVIRYFLRMTTADLEDLENELRKKYEPIIRKPAAKSARNVLLRGSSSAESSRSGFQTSEKDLTYLFQQDSRAMGEGILDTLFKEDPVITVFTLAKDVVVMAKEEQVSEALGDQTDAIVYNKALRNITSKMDMSALGLSDNMTEYLTMGTTNHAAKGTQEFEKLKTNINTALGGFSTALASAHTHAHQHSVEAEASATMKKIGSMPMLYSLQPAPRGEPSAAQGLAATYGRRNQVLTSHKDKKKKSLRMPPISMSQTTPYASNNNNSLFMSQSHKPYCSSSSGHPLGISEFASSADLTHALVSSLRTMQKHTNMIKESISSAQNVVNIADPKAKELIFSVAAESMRKALQPLLHYELKRGFTAWTFVLRQERRQEKAGVFIHFCTVRNTLLALDESVKRVLGNRMARWKDFTFMETQRLRKEKMLKAVLKIQGIFRGRMAKKKVDVLRQRRKYQKLYDSTIKLQALFRGKLGRWTFLRNTRDKKYNKGAIAMQSILRGYLARKRVYIMRLRRNKALAATNIQKIVRSRIAFRRVQLLLRDKRHGAAATVIQCCIRGYLGRKHIARILIDIARYKYAVRIQAMVRGALGRIHLAKKIAEMERYRSHRAKAATSIQAAYRGYRCSVLYKMMMYKVNKTKKEEARAATAMNRIVRGFVARAYLRELRRLQREQWVADARHFKETWADDSESWFYYNEATGEALWEPSAMGYTKSDGYLVLANGEIIEDPALVRRDPDYERGEEDEEEEVKAVVPDRKRNAKLCSECADRTATRGCNECGDKFCTKCYKYMHATGTRRLHTFTALGPIDCTECELRLAERWCVSCDEAYCDGCWRKVHSKGKRVFHPYSEVSPEGRIDARIYTMDGDQLSDYDSAYSQQRVDVNAYNTKQEAVQQQIELHQQQQYANDGYNTEGYATEGYGEGYGDGYGGDGYNYASNDESTVAIYDNNNTAGYASWEQYYDDDGNPYWYDASSGVSQYENPYEYA